MIQIKSLIIALNAILLLPIVAANPILTAIFYDPVGADTGFEWIELYNPSNESVSLSDYVLFKGNGAVASDWTRLPILSGTIAPKSFYLIGENNVSMSDIKQSIGLFNGPDSIKLVFENNTIDLIGYGNLTFDEYYLENPAIDVVSGKALVRRFEKENQTYVFSQIGNNAIDWAFGDAMPRNSLYGIFAPFEQNVSVTLIVPTEETNFFVDALSDDILAKTGYQWSLIHPQTVDVILQNNGGLNENVTFYATVGRDLVSFDVSLQQSTLSKSFTELREELIVSLPLGILPGNYSLRIYSKFGDSSKLIAERDIEVLASIGITTCEDMTFIRINDSIYDATCLVTNVGNVAAKMNATLSFESKFDFKAFVMDTNIVNLSEALIELQPAESKEIHLQAQISGFLRAGFYEGSLLVNAWPE